MRRMTPATAVLLLTQSLASTGQSQGVTAGIDLGGATPKHVHACTVVSLDSVSMNFVCQDRRAARQYWVTRATQFVAGWPNPSFFGLGIGEQVRVISHNAGRTQVADIVHF
jgi:hypothetical protein